MKQKIQVAVAVAIVVVVYLVAAVAMWREGANLKTEQCPMCGRESVK